MTTDIRSAVAYDFPASETLADWRRTLAWPRVYGDVRGHLRGALTAFVRHIASISDPDDHAIAALACGPIFRIGGSLAEMAITAAAAHREGIGMHSSSRDLDYLAGTSDAPEPMAPLPYSKSSPSVPKAFLRRLARTSQWTPTLAMPATVLAPHVVVHSCNSLLDRCAKASPQRKLYRHAETDFARVIALTEYGPTPSRWQVLIAPLVDVLVPAGLPAPIGARLRNLLTERSGEALGLAERQLAAARRLPRMPGITWAGTGGYWPSRVLGLEALRRGHSVVRFDHGDNRALHDVGEWLALVDLFAADRLVMPSEGMASRWRTGRLEGLIPAGRERTIEAAPPKSRAEAYSFSPPPTSNRPRVLYAPGILRGFRQTIPAALPDIVYLDWQMRLAELIRDMPVELLCRPHPEGLLLKRAHPLNTIVDIPTESFEGLVAAADTMLFDDPYSRVFCQALVSGKPVVFIDFGAGYLADDVRPLVERIARILPIGWSDRGLPVINCAALEEALRKPMTPDPDAVAELRKLFS